MLVATTIGGVLLMTAAYTAGAYSQAVATLQADDFSDHETAMARIMQDVRYAWWVQIPSASRIEVGDHRGRVRSYHLDGGNLIATDHDNAQGVLCGDVAALTFEGLPVRRLREATPQTVNGSIVQVTTRNVLDRTLALAEGGSVAVPFMVSATHGEVGVSGVAEQVLSVTPTTLSLPLTAAVNGGSIRVEIFPARAPGDARPRPDAASKGSATVSVEAFPVAAPKNPGSASDIFAVLEEAYGVTNTMKVAGITVPLPRSTITDLINLIAKLQQLEVDSDYDPLTAEVVKLQAPFATSGAMVSFDVSGRFASLEPGVAYTLVISLESGMGLGVLANAAAAVGDELAALKLTRAASLTKQSVQVPFSMTGNRRITATTATDSLAVVHATLVPGSGTTLTKATPVYSQTLAADPWHGVLPGESSP